jgi:hypothetical protein
MNPSCVVDDADEAAAFALLADTLIRDLGLDHSCHQEVLAELYRERALVCRWLTRAGADTTRANPTS